MRRRWNRAFASIFALSLLGAAASTVIVTHLVGSTRAAAEDVQRQLFEFVVGAETWLLGRFVVVIMGACTASRAHR